MKARVSMCLMVVFLMVGCAEEQGKDQGGLVFVDSGARSVRPDTGGMDKLDMSSTGGEDLSVVKEEMEMGAVEMGGGMEVPYERGPSYTLSQSSANVPMPVAVFGKEGPVVLVLGAMRPWEKAPMSFGWLLEAELWRGLASEVGIQVVYVANSNPDGVVIGESRNGNGVDIQYNFDTTQFDPTSRGGKEAFSESETLLVKRLVEELKPEVMVSVRCCEDGMFYTGPGAKAWAEGLQESTKLTAKPDPLEPGSLERWVSEGMGGNVLTIQMSRDSSKEDAQESLVELNVVKDGLTRWLRQLEGEGTSGVNAQAVVEALGKEEIARKGQGMLRGYRYGVSGKRGLPLGVDRLGVEPRRGVLLLMHPGVRGDKVALLAGMLRHNLIYTRAQEQFELSMIWVANPEWEGSDLDEAWVQDFDEGLARASTKALDEWLKYSKPKMILVVGQTQQAEAQLRSDGVLNFDQVEVVDTDYLRVAINKNEPGEDRFVKSLRAKGWRVAEFYSPELYLPRKDRSYRRDIQEVVELLIKLFRNNSR